MSKPKRPRWRWRWASRDFRPSNDATARYLWARRPQRVGKGRRAPHDDYWALGGAGCFVDAAYFRKRFGRDLKPGELRRLA